MNSEDIAKATMAARLVITTTDDPNIVMLTAAALVLNTMQRTGVSKEVALQIFEDTLTTLEMVPKIH